MIAISAPTENLDKTKMFTEGYVSEKIETKNAKITQTEEKKKPKEQVKAKPAKKIAKIKGHDKK